MRIKREETRRSITVLFVTLNKKTHTVSALDCTVHRALSTPSALSTQCTTHL